MSSRAMSRVIAFLTFNPEGTFVNVGAEHTSGVTDIIGHGKTTLNFADTHKVLAW